MSKKPPLELPVLLKPTHQVEGFDCGVEVLNTYLKRFADINNRNGSARTYVALRENVVVGYYTIAPGSVEKERVPGRVGHGLARHPVPIILLARLAVDKSEKGKGLGEGLLKDALVRVLSAAEIIGGRALLVHAKDETAKSFYEHFGFEPSPIDAFHLYLLMKDIRKSLRE
ncbi:MAG: GNAT family N-acetyltransferase [Candidatus Omnitrophota bacterium]